MKKSGADGEGQTPAHDADLRRRAEERFAARPAAAAPAPAEAAALSHELGVHQIELEMQNDELRGAQLELEVQRAKYFELFDLAPVGYLTISDKGIVGDANLTAARLLGVERQMLVGEPFSAFVFAADRDAYYLHLRTLETTGAPQTCELRLRRFGGDAGSDAGAGHFWAQYESVLQSAADGEPLSSRVTFSDISARKQAEGALREREVVFRGIVEQAVDSISVVDAATGRFIEFNDAACRNLGYSRDELASLGVGDIDLRWPGAAVVQVLADLGAKGADVFETQHRRKDGEVRDVRVSASTVEVAGRPCFAAIWTDITERKQATAELARHREQLEELVAARTDELSAANRILAEGAVEVARWRQNFDTFFNTIDDLLFVLDVDGAMIHVNETVCRRLGYSEDELLGRPVLDVHPPERRDEAGRIVAAMLAGEAAFCPVPVVTKGGAEIPVETRVVPGVWDGEPALFGVTKDVTALRISEEKFSRAFHSAPALTAISTVAEGRFVDVNEVFLTTLGFTRQEVIGRTSADLGVFDDLRLRAEVLGALSEQGRARNIAVDARAEDGRIVHGLFSADPLVVGGEACLLTTMLDVTERKQAEEALQESEALYRSILDASPDGVTVTDLEGRVRMASPAGLAMFGNERDEDVAGRSPLEFLVPEDRERAQADLALTLQGAYQGPSEYRGLRADGSTFAVEIRGELIRGAHEQPTGMVLIARDITERQRAEDALRESEDKFRTVADFTYDWEAWRAPDGAYLYVSPSCERISGHAAAEFMADPDLTVQITHPDDRPKVGEHCRVAGHEAQDQALELDYRILTPSGETRSISHSCTPVYGEDGQWLGRRESNRDISARKRTEDALRASEEKYRLLIERSQDIVYTLSTDGVFTFVSPAWTMLLGHPPSEVVGQPWERFIHPDDAPACMAFMQRMTEPGRRREVVEYRMRHLDGSWRWHAASAGVSRDEAGTVVGFEGAARDVTERRRAEEALRASEEQLTNAIAGSGVGLWDWHVQTGEEAFSERLAEIVGYTLDELSPATVEVWEGLCHPDDLRRSDELLEQHFAGQTALYECEVRLRHKDGHWVWVLDRGKVSEWDDDGRPVRMIGTDLDITERKRAEDALRESEATLRANIENSFDVIFTLDEEGVFLFVSSAWERHFGYPVSDVLQRSFAPFVHPDDVAPLADYLGRVLSTGKSETSPAYRVKHADGGWRWLVSNGTPYVDAEGARRYIGVGRDITERKQTEEALRQSEARYRTLIESASDGITVTDAQGRFVDANLTACRMLGYSREELLGQSLSERLLAEDIPRLAPLMEALIAGETSKDEWRYLRKDGSLLLCEVAATLLPDGRLLGIARDISERKKAEEALRQATDRLTLATRAGGVGVWDYDPVNDTLTWDEQMFALYGVTREQFGGAYEAWQAGLHPEDRERGDAEIQAALRGEQEFDTEFRVLRPDGTIRDIRALALVQRDAAGRATHVIGTNWDITGAKLAEARLRDANQRLEEAVARANDLAVEAQAATTAKSEFLAHMSHEIRTPLNAIIGFAQLLQHDPQLSAQQGDRVEIINRSGEHLLALLSDVLELSKVEAGRQNLDPTTFDLRELLEDLALVFRVRAEAKHLAFGADGLDQAPRFVTADQLKLRQILTNLLGNAVKFTDAGGVLFRALAAGKGAGAARLVVLVEDTGPGIAADEMGALFAPFEQTTAGRLSGSGTGLGLAISRRFALIMGGDLSVASEAGKGSVFRLEIPLGAASEAAAAAAAAADTAARYVLRLVADQPHCRVLVVDDDPDSRTLLREMLSEAGFDVFEAADGFAAAAAFASRRPRLVIMADWITDMAGAEAIRRMRQSQGGAAAKIIMLAAGATEEARELALAAGADAFMAKPFRAAELFEQIRLLTGVRYVYAEAATPEAAVTDLPPALTREMMYALPAELREQLREAAVRARHGRLVELTGQVAALDPETGEKLQKAIARFDYAAVLRALEQGPS